MVLTNSVVKLGRASRPSQSQLPTARHRLVTGISANINACQHAVVRLGRFDPRVKAESTRTGVRTVGNERVLNPVTDTVVGAFGRREWRRNRPGAGLPIGADGTRVELRARDQTAVKEFA